MIDTVTKAIATCIICQKYEKARIFDHPARALKITGLFDRVGIDLVFGFPLTSEGYKGILLVTDYLSKYPFAFRIKSKTAMEIASKFFQFISYFGPPKELLSDQGNEFLNQLVQHVSLVCGVERKVTAAYHPRTNGLTERFNQSMVNALRKHAAMNPEDWDQWLPYILLAARTRVHSTTGLSPIELVTGQKAHNFESWSCTDADFEQELNERCKQLKTLIEETRPNTIVKINTQQLAQQKRQNNLKNVVSTHLPIGTTVYVKSMRIQAKLQPLYHGPYTVHAVDATDNYQLTTSKGEILAKKFPLCQLKVVEPTEDSVILFEKILEHKSNRRGQFEYLVKYCNKPVEEASWIKENHFTATDLIEEYWASHKPEELVLFSHSATPPQPTMQYLDHHIQRELPETITTVIYFLVFLMFFTFHTSTAQRLTGPFKLCDTNNRLIVKSNLQCDTYKFTNKSIEPQQERWHLFNKRKLKIHGSAYIYMVKWFWLERLQIHFFLAMKNFKYKIGP